MAENYKRTIGHKMPNEITVPDELKEVINDILAEEEKLKKEREAEEGNLERLYIWDYEEEPEEEKSNTIYISMV